MLVYNKQKSLSAQAFIYNA